MLSGDLETLSAGDLQLGLEFVGTFRIDEVGCGAYPVGQANLQVALQRCGSGLVAPTKTTTGTGGTEKKGRDGFSEAPCRGLK